MSLSKILEKKIHKSKLNTIPFPILIIKNFLPSKLLSELSNSLPSYSNLSGNNIFIQSKSGTKRSVFLESQYFKKFLKRNNNIKKVINLFKILEPALNSKFSNIIPRYINKDYINKKTNFSCSFSSCKKNYLKSPHIDRREHKFHILFYPQIQNKSGGEICLWECKERKIYDVFPDENKLKLYKTIKASPNTCIITLNTPGSYHSVKKYTGSVERKYLYFVYDFPCSKENYKLKSRLKGNNKNSFWKYPVKVFSQKRLKKFLAE